eukprot:9197187-Alexandrium_andersonii.AAC.1
MLPVEGCCRPRATVDRQTYLEVCFLTVGIGLWGWAGGVSACSCGCWRGDARPLPKHTMSR